MKNISRKEREFLQREQLILDTAKQLLDEEGYSNLTMDKIAAEIEYSKGTVYKHFSSKEEVISAIGSCCVDNLYEMFKRATAYKGNHRERITAIGVAHSLYAQLNPIELENLQLIKSPAVREKVSIEVQMEMQKKEYRLTQIVTEVVVQAIEEGDIIEPHPQLPDAIVFGLWTMNYGSNLLHMSGIPFKEIGMCGPLDVMWLNSHKLLDSYNWQPLSDQFDIEQLRQDILHSCFAEELKQLEHLKS